MALSKAEVDTALRLAGGKWRLRIPNWCDLCRGDKYTQGELEQGLIPWVCEEHAREFGLLW